MLNLLALERMMEKEKCYWGSKKNHQIDSWSKKKQKKKEKKEEKKKKQAEKANSPLNQKARVEIKSDPRQKECA